jgi:hypothetical protein
LTYLPDSRKVSQVFALLALLLTLGVGLQAQTVEPVQVRTHRRTIARSPTRQQRSLIRHNEAGAIMTLRTLFSAEATYQSTAGNGDYGTIEELRKENLIDYVLAEGHRFGYLFRIRREKFSPESPSSLEIVAVPRIYRRTGRRSFYMNETGVIHALDKNGTEASPGDDVLVIDP